MRFHRAWQPEYACTYGEPPADSIAAAFPRYLTDQGDKDILREFGGVALDNDRRWAIGRASSPPTAFCSQPCGDGAAGSLDRSGSTRPAVTMADSSE